MSRARLGLFVLGRARLFSSCLELKPTFSKLLERPTELHIIPDETYPTKRKHGSECKSKSVSMEELTKTVVEKVQGWEQQQQNQMQH
jgi:intron-binding protein aquarius